MNFEVVRKLLNKTRFMELDEIEIFRKSICEPTANDKDKDVMARIFLTMMDYVYRHKRLKYIFLSISAFLTYSYMIFEKF